MFKWHMLCHPPTYLHNADRYHSCGDSRDTTTKQPISSAAGKQAPSCRLPCTDRQTDRLLHCTNHQGDPLLFQISLTCRWAIAYACNYGKHRRLVCPNWELQPVAEVLCLWSQMSNIGAGIPPPPYHWREKPQGSLYPGVHASSKSMRLTLHKRALSTVGKITSLPAAVSTVLDECK